MSCSLHPDGTEPPPASFFQAYIDGRVFTSMLASCIGPEGHLMPRELAALSASCLKCRTAAEQAASEAIRLMCPSSSGDLPMRPSGATASLAAAAWSAQLAPGSRLFLAMAQGFHWLPRVLVSQSALSSPLVRTQDYEDFLGDDEHQACLSEIAKLCNMHGSPGPFSFQQLLRKMHNLEPSIYHDVWSSTPEASVIRQWFFCEQDLKAEMARQGVSEVDLLFCLRWHLFKVIDDDLSTTLQKRHIEIMGKADPHPNWSTTTCSRQADSAAHVAVSAYFLLMSRLGYLDREDGGCTLFETVLARICDASFQKPCFLAWELTRMGQLHGYPYGPTLPDRKNPERLLTRTAALLPARVCSGVCIPDSSLGDNDTRSFISISGRLAHTIQLLLEASLGHVLMSCDSTVAGSSADSVELVASMCFELTQPGTAVLVLFFLNYLGLPANFNVELKEQFWYCENPLDDLLRAFRFCDEVYECIKRFPDLNQQDSLVEPLADWEVAREVVKSKRALLEL